MKKATVRANLSIEKDVEKVCQAFEDVELSDDQMDTETDEDIMIVNGLMAKSVRIQIPDNGTVEPDLLRNDTNARTITRKFDSIRETKRREKRIKEVQLRSAWKNVMSGLRRMEKQAIEAAEYEFPHSHPMWQFGFHPSHEDIERKQEKLEERKIQFEVKRYIQHNASAGNYNDESFPLPTYAFNTMKVRAWLNKTRGDKRVWAISDGGADATVLGKNAHIISQSSQKALIMGYDQSAEPKRVPICTALIKVMPNTGTIPVLLKIHEAPYIKDNPVTLISEIQVQQKGIAIDSTAMIHCTPQGTPGTQGMILNDVLKISFTNCGGIMGFKILPFKKGDQDRYEINQITSEQLWTLQYFCDDESKDSDPEEAFLNNLFNNYTMEEITQLYLHNNPDEIPSNPEPQYSAQSVHAFGTRAELADPRLRPGQDVLPDTALSNETTSGVARMPCGNESTDDSSSEGETSSNRPISGKRDRNSDSDSDVKPPSKTSKFAPYDPSDTTITMIGEPLACRFDPVYYSNTVQQQHEEDTVVRANTTCSWHRVSYDRVDPKKIQPYLSFRPLHIVKLTLKRTTQMAKMTISQPLRRHLKTRYGEFFHVKRIDEMVSTDPIFANVRCLHYGYIGCQIFYGATSHCINAEGFRGKGEFPGLYRDFIRKHGAPSILRRDNAKEEASIEVDEIQRELYIKDQWSEPFYPNQNPVEGKGIRWLKSASHVLMDRTGAPPQTWYFAIMYLCEVHERTADPSLPGQVTPFPSDAEWHHSRYFCLPSIHFLGSNCIP